MLHNTMTVRELITELQKVDPNMLVLKKLKILPRKTSAIHYFS